MCACWSCSSLWRLWQGLGEHHLSLTVNENACKPRPGLRQWWRAELLASDTSRSWIDATFASKMDGIPVAMAAMSATRALIGALGPPGRVAGLTMPHTGGGGGSMPQGSMQAPLPLRAGFSTSPKGTPWRAESPQESVEYLCMN